MKQIIKSPIQQIRYVRYEIYQALEKQKKIETSPTKFIIFSGARSGSTLFCDLLNAHPEILCHRELFHLQTIDYNVDIGNEIGFPTIEERDRNIELFLAKIWQQNLNKKAVGFKIFRNQNPTVNSLLIKDKQVQKIVLTRKNKIKTYVSLLLAKKHNEWIIDEKTAPQDKERKQGVVKINLESLQNWIQVHDRYYESIRQALEKSKQSFLEISYEDLIGADNELVKSNVLKFLGVSIQPHLLRASLKKQNSDRLVDLISNFEELEKKLSGTELASLLHS
jgi:LPS sulfotransferase NodH